MSLSQEILEGTYQGVERLLLQGAPLNLLDEYGYTPLIHATATNRQDLVQLLLNHQARVDLVDITGSNALHWAVDNDNLAISQLLLQNGANPNAYAANGQPVLFYPLLRKNRSLTELLVKHGGNVEVARDFINAKLIGHRFELKGNSDIITHDGLFLSINLEGFYLEFTLDIIRQSLERFIYSYVARRTDVYEEELKRIITSFTHAAKLREFKHFSKNVEANRQTIYNLVQCDLLLLPVSYQAHAINFIKHDSFLAKCDRGVQQMMDPIVIYQVGNPKLLTNDFYLNLMYQKHTEKFIKVDLHRLLTLKPYAKLPIKHQVTGNCSWANSEAAVPTMLYMLLHAKLPHATHDLVEKIMRFYHTWLEWDKDRAIEDWLEDFEKSSFQKQKTKAALLGAILFQALEPNKPNDIKRAQKILGILARKEFQYIVRTYTNVFVYSQKSTQGKRFQRLVEMCGYQLNQFRLS